MFIKTLHFFTLTALLFIHGLAFAQAEHPADQAPAEKINPLKVTFINPAASSEFWRIAQDFLQAAADSLGVELEVLRAENRYQNFGLAQRLARSASSPGAPSVNPAAPGTKPDYVFFIYQANLARKIFDLFEGADIRFLTFNTDVIAADKAAIGQPGQPYRRWVAHSHPWTDQAGYDLAKNLFASIRAKTGQSAVRLVAISGSHDSAASQELNAGLQRAIAEDGKVELLQLVYSQWKKADAQNQVEGLLRRYPQSNGIWVIGNEATLGALEGVESSGRRPGLDILIGGTIASAAGIAAIEQGKVNANMGADLWEAAWNLVRVYDFHHGKAFPEANATLRYQTEYVSAHNIAPYKQLITLGRYREVDFRRFSRILTPDADSYAMTASSLLQAIPVSIPASSTPQP